MEQPALGLSTWLVLWQVGGRALVYRRNLPGGLGILTGSGKPQVFRGPRTLITKAPEY